MPWKIEFSTEAFRDLNKLEVKDARMVLKRLEKACSNPYHYFKRLTGEEDYNCVQAITG